MGIGGVYFFGAGAGTMNTMGEQVQFIRYVVVGQSLRQQKRVLHRYGGVVYGVPDEKRWQIFLHVVFQAKSCTQIVIGTGQIVKRPLVSKNPGTDNRIRQDHRIRPRFFAMNSQCAADRFGIPQNGSRSCQMPAGRKTANRYLEWVYPQAGRIAAQVQDGSGSIDHRLPTQRRGGYGIQQRKDLVSGLQKLHGYRVGFPGAATLVSTAGQKQHRRTDVIVRHFGCFIPQISGKNGAAGQSMRINLHKKNLPLSKMDHS